MNQKTQQPSPSEGLADSLAGSPEAKRRLLHLGVTRKSQQRRGGGLAKKGLCGFQVKHGFCIGGKRLKLASIHSSMVTRCYNPNCKAYSRYGGRGIRVCDRWMGESGLANFAADMGDPPEGMSLERKDNDLGYSKENCKWATRKEQNNNSSKNRVIEFNGRKQNLCQWAEEIGISPTLLWARIFRCGWSIEDALCRPRRKHFSRP